MSSRLATAITWHRIRAMVIKEFIQLTRDRASFAMIVLMPLMQLLLFGYAINSTPRDLPTAVLHQAALESVAAAKLKNLWIASGYQFWGSVWLDE